MLMRPRGGVLKNRDTGRTASRVLKLSRCSHAAPSEASGVLVAIFSAHRRPHGATRPQSALRHPGLDEGQSDEGKDPTGLPYYVYL